MPENADLPLYVVLNARSGRGDAQAVRQTVESVLSASARRFEVLEALEPADLPTCIDRAAHLAREHGGALVAAGGDGTVNAVVQAALAHGVPMGVLPQGTFNYFSREHDIPSETEAATRALLQAAPQPVQVGRITGGDGRSRPFLVNASLGLYPKLLEDREAAKREHGRHRLVAAWAALLTLSTAHRPLRLVLRTGAERGADQLVRTQTLFVGNNALQLQQTGLPGVAALEQGRLVAVTVAPVGTLAMLALMLRGAFGRLGEADSVVSFGFAQLVVQPAAPLGRRRMKVAADGEVFWQRAPLIFDPWPEPLQLLRPPSPVPKP